MVTHRTLGELEEAQDDQRRQARLRIELAEEYLLDYRSCIREVQERFHEVALREGVGDDPAFRYELRRTSAIVDEHVVQAGRRVTDLEDKYDQLLRSQADEREFFLAQPAGD